MTQIKDIKSLRADYNRRKSNGDNDFLSFDDFNNWYNEQKKVCEYCGLKEEESQIIVTTKLESNRFPKNGKPGRGTARGMHLEVDRINPKGKYSRENCTLCCYFCNNDKSDVFNGAQYKEFFQDRASYLRKLIKDKNGN
jgi:hypothetical protein